MSLAAAIAGAAALAQTPYEDAMRHAQQHQNTQLPKPVALTDKDMTSFIDAVVQLKELGVEAMADPGQGELQTLVRAIQTSSSATAILERNGFSVERFRQVTYTIGLSLAGLDTKSKGGEIDKPRAEQEKALVQMKAQLPPEQYELMKKQLEAANGTLEQLQRQSPQNLELVARYRQKLEAATSD